MKKPDLKKELAEAQKKQLAANKAVEKIANKIKKAEEVKKPKSIFDEVKTPLQVFKKLKVDPTKDVIKIDGFDKADIDVLKNLVMRMRVAKVYNVGKVPKKCDKRWYPWHSLKSSGSGLVFYHSTYNDDDACTSSAARLSFVNREGSDNYVKNFMHVEEGIIGL